MFTSFGPHTASNLTARMHATTIEAVARPLKGTLVPLSRRAVFTLSPDTYDDRDLLLLTVNGDPTEDDIRAARQFLRTIPEDVVEDIYDTCRTSEAARRINTMLTEAGFNAHVCRIPTLEPLLTF